MIYNTKNDIKNQMNNSIISLYWNIGKNFRMKYFKDRRLSMEKTLLVN